MAETTKTDAPIYAVGALPPFKVSYINPAICGGGTDRWFVMGTVDGNPRNGQGPVAICEYEPSAHAIAALLNATVRNDHFVTLPKSPRLSWWRGLWAHFTLPAKSQETSA